MKCLLVDSRANSSRSPKANVQYKPCFHILFPSALHLILLPYQCSPSADQSIWSLISQHISFWPDFLQTDWDAEATPDKKQFLPSAETMGRGWGEGGKEGRKEGPLEAGISN